MNRVTLHHTQLHHIRTTTLEGKLGISSIQATIDNLRMRWAGHVARMPETRLPRRFLTSWVRAKRRPGRPNFSTVQCISDTIQRAGIDISKWVDYAGDREAWRAITAAVKPKPARKPLQTEIEIGPDGAQERCFNCKRGGKALVVCDRAKLHSSLARAMPERNCRQKSDRSYTPGRVVLPAVHSETELHSF